MTKSVSNRDICFNSVIIVKTRALLIEFCVAWLFLQPPPPPILFGLKMVVAD